MSTRPGLNQVLTSWSSGDATRTHVASAVMALASASCRIASLIAMGPVADALGAPTGKRGATDEQKKLDVIANDWIIEALRRAPVATLASEEMEVPLDLAPGAPLIVAVDPIDGSSNIDANISIGTIFSVLPADAGSDTETQFLQPGKNQLAAGFVVYGPFTTLTLTVGDGTQIFTLDRTQGEFLLTQPHVDIDPQTQEYALNTSNYRHWDEPMRIYADDCRKGKDGPRGKDFNMRWTASPVSDIYRILSRGGVFLYPGDARDGYKKGRLRLVYEANPLAWIIEQANGAASTGYERILDLIPEHLHQHVPIVAGSREEVAYIIRLHEYPIAPGESSPLFGRRGLFWRRV